jgi:DNA-binding transcriptional regulator YiaG
MLQALAPCNGQEKIMKPAELKNILKELEFTQKGAANLIKTHFTTLNRWLAGTCPIPGPVETLFRLMIAAHRAKLLDELWVEVMRCNETE